MSEPIISPRALNYARAVAARDGLTPRAVLRRMVDLSIAAHMADALTIRGQRRLADRNDRLAA